MSPTEKHNVKAESILDKGMEVLWENGYNGTSVSDIVKAAGIPKGSFYFYFDSKEDFVVNAIEKYFKIQGDPFLSLLDDNSIPAIQRLRSFYTKRLELLESSPTGHCGCLASNIGSEMAEHSECIRKVIESKENFFKSKLISVAEEAQRDNQLDINIKASDLIHFIEDAGKGAMISMKIQNNLEPVKNLMNIVLNVLLK